MSIDYQTFFCLAAKVRSAQKAYFKAKDCKDPSAKDKLLYSLKLEKLLDGEIQRALSFWPAEDLKKKWNEYLTIERANDDLMKQIFYSDVRG